MEYIKELIYGKTNRFIKCYNIEAPAKRTEVDTLDELCSIDDVILYMSYEPDVDEELDDILTDCINNVKWIPLRAQYKIDKTTWSNLESDIRQDIYKIVSRNFTPPKSALFKTLSYDIYYTTEEIGDSLEDIKNEIENRLASFFDTTMKY